MLVQFHGQLLVDAHRDLVGLKCIDYRVDDMGAPLEHKIIQAIQIADYIVEIQVVVVVVARLAIVVHIVQTVRIDDKMLVIVGKHVRLQQVQHVRILMVRGVHIVRLMCALKPYDRQLACILYGIFNFDLLYGLQILFFEIVVKRLVEQVEQRGKLCVCVIPLVKYRLGRLIEVEKVFEHVVCVFPCVPSVDQVPLRFFKCICKLLEVVCIDPMRTQGLVEVLIQEDL